MFTFTDKPQTLPQLWSHGLNLLKLSISSVWYWSLIISAVANLYPQLVMKKAIVFADSLIHSQVIAAFIGMMILFPVLVFLSSLLMQRIYVAGARTKQRLHTSVLHVTKKMPLLLSAVFLISFITSTGLYLMIVPGVFTFVLFVFVVPIILIDNKNFWESFKISTYLVWGNWWRIFAIVLFPLALIILASFFSTIFTGFWRYTTAILLSSVLMPLCYCMVLNGFSDAKLRHSMKPLHTKMSKEKVSDAAKG